mgnify:CR=1 FL=1
MTISTAMTIASAPSTPAAHSRARCPGENVLRAGGGRWLPVWVRGRGVATGRASVTGRAVLVDGMAVSQLEPQSLRRQVGYVPQDVVLFHGDIRENILLGNAQAGDAQLLEALRLSCLDETLAQMPHGLGTQVGERGDRLSGGQRQAVSIARALVQQPRMLLLDEPSSMMDPGTEARLIDNLRNIKGVTLLLVTHRMAMLPLVDRLVVLDQGRVVLDGPRAEVLRKLQGSTTPATPKEFAA